MNNAEKVVGWCMMVLAVIFVAILLSSCATTQQADAFAWEPIPGAQPCAPDAIVWRQVPWPIPSGQAADADVATCTIVSGYSEERAKHVRAAGQLSNNPTSVWEHERYHLLHAVRHPAGQELPGWGRVYAPPELPDWASR